MASVDNQTMHRLHPPALATTYEGLGIPLLQRLVPLVDYLEIPPDSISRTRDGRTSLRPECLDEIASVMPLVGTIVHGVGLSIGSYDSWNESYIRLLDEFFDRFTPRWHSEHLGYTTVAGEPLGTMIALPRTKAMLELVCTRIQLLQERYKVPFLIEHIIHLLPDAPADYSPAAFLNAITSQTGCGLILDAYNLECDRHNSDFDIPAFLDELNLDPVKELHVAGGFTDGTFQLDIHSQPAADSTLVLALDIIHRCPNLDIVTYEILKEAIPTLGYDGLCNELARVRKAIASC